MAPLRDLELMIQSHYPLIAIETFEEARLERILAEVATSLRVPFFVWSVTTGLKRYGNLNSIYDSQTPIKALNNVAAMPGEGLFLFKDLHRYFEKPEVLLISGLYTAFSRSVELSTDIVLDELRSTRPLSVTRREEIDALRAWARERAVIAN